MLVFCSDLYETFIEPYVAECWRPVSEGDLVAVQGAMRIVEFKVTRLLPELCGYIAPTTVVMCDGRPIKRAVSKRTHICIQPQSRGYLLA